MVDTEQNAQADAIAGVDRSPVSAVKLPADLTARVDGWARAHGIHRSEAIRRLVEIGLKSEPAEHAARGLRFDAVAVEQLAASQIDRFIDPATPREERE